MTDARQGTELLARLIATREREGAPGAVAAVEVRARGRELVLCGAGGGGLARGGRRPPPPAFCALLPDAAGGREADAAATVELVREWLEACGSEVRFVERTAADAAAAREAWEGLRGARRRAPPPMSPGECAEEGLRMAGARAGGRYAFGGLARAGVFTPGVDGLTARLEAEARARHHEDGPDDGPDDGPGDGPGDGPVPHFPVMLADAIIAFGRVDAADGGGGRVKVEVLNHRGPGPRPGPVYLRMGDTAVAAADRAMAFLGTQAAGPGPLAEAPQLPKAYSGRLPEVPAPPGAGPGAPAGQLPREPIPPGRSTAFGVGWMDRQDGEPREKGPRLPPEVRAAWRDGWDAREAAVSEGWPRPGPRGGEG